MTVSMRECVVAYQINSYHGCCKCPDAIPNRQPAAGFEVEEVKWLASQLSTHSWNFSCTLSGIVLKNTNP